MKKLLFITLMVFPLSTLTGQDSVRRNSPPPPPPRVAQINPQLDMDRSAAMLHRQYSVTREMRRSVAMDIRREHFKRYLTPNELRELVRAQQTIERLRITALQRQHRQ